MIGYIQIRINVNSANDEYLRRTGFETRSARNQSYIKELKVKIKNQS